MGARKTAVFCFLALNLAAIAGWTAPLATQIQLPTNKEKPAAIRLAGDKLVLIYRQPGLTSRVAVISREGHEAFTRMPAADISDAVTLTIFDAVLTNSGVLVVSVAVPNARGQGAHALLEYDVSAGSLVRMVRTTPLRCYSLAADGDGIWCLGVDGEKEKTGEDYGVVSLVALTGEVIRTLLQRSELARPVNTREGPTGSVLVAGGASFAAWLPANKTLLTWRAGGAGLKRVELAPRALAQHNTPDLLAMLPDGRLIAMLAVGSSEADPTESRRGFFEIDLAGMPVRMTGTAAGEVPPGRFLAGGDADSLVFYVPASDTIEWMMLESRSRS